MDSFAVFGLYAQLAPAELFRLLQRQMGVKVRNGIYSARLVIWMMINQRLQARGTLASSVEQLVQGRFDSVLSQCKRAREKKIALSTGGYCQARQHLPKLLVSRSMDELAERLPAACWKRDLRSPIGCICWTDLPCSWNMSRNWRRPFRPRAISMANRIGLCCG
jgi:hypothetical protein